jgi:hypothetical protein
MIIEKIKNSKGNIVQKTNKYSNIINDLENL